MKLIETTVEFRRWRADRDSVGLVPTMGALHSGHEALIRHCRRTSSHVVVSLFVNPIQFGPNEDYRNYPRDLQADARVAGSAGADVLFSPAVEEMYGPDFQTAVTVGGNLTSVLCGAHRPGHFTGVATVVTKLFCIVRPDLAVFGQKDAQQLLVIRALNRDLNLGVRIVALPTVRESDGLAISSRNRYLTTDERRAATRLYAALCGGRDAIMKGERDPAAVQAAMLSKLRAEPLISAVDYAEVRTVPELRVPATLTGDVLLAVAARIGAARLIDNIAVSIHPDGATEITS